MNACLCNFFQEGSAAKNNRAGKVEFYSNPLLEICGTGAAKQTGEYLEILVPWGVGGVVDDRVKLESAVINGEKMCQRVIGFSEIK